MDLEPFKNKDGSIYKKENVWLQHLLCQPRAYAFGAAATRLRVGAPTTAYASVHQPLFTKHWLIRGEAY